MTTDLDTAITARKRAYATAQMLATTSVGPARDRLRRKSFLHNVLACRLERMAGIAYGQRRIS